MFNIDDTVVYGTSTPSGNPPPGYIWAWADSSGYYFRNNAGTTVNLFSLSANTHFGNADITALASRIHEFAVGRNLTIQGRGIKKIVSETSGTSDYSGIVLDESKIEITAANDNTLDSAVLVVRRDGSVYIGSSLGEIEVVGANLDTNNTGDIVIIDPTTGFLRTIPQSQVNGDTHFANTNLTSSAGATHNFIGALLITGGGNKSFHAVSGSDSSLFSVQSAVTNLYVTNGSISTLLSLAKDGTYTMDSSIGKYRLNTAPTLDSDLSTISLLGRDSSTSELRTINLNSLKTIVGSGSPVDGTTKAWWAGQIYIDNANIKAPIFWYALTKSTNPDTSAVGSKWVKQTVNKYILPIACSDESTDLTDGDTTKFHIPCGFYLTEIRAGVNTASTGTDIIVDFDINGSSILSTKVHIDEGDKTSVGSATPAVISTPTITDNSEATITIDQIGSTIAGTGLKIYLIGYQL